MRTRLTLTIALTALACLAGGCSFFPTGSTTNITVRYTSESLLHMAHLPAEVEDGDADELREELVSKLAESAEAVTLMPAMGSVMREEDQPPEAARVSLLLVDGPPELGLVIWRFLREEYDIARPWVVSLPTQALAQVAVPEPPETMESDVDTAEGD